MTVIGLLNNVIRVREFQGVPSLLSVLEDMIFDLPSCLQNHSVGRSKSHFPDFKVNNF